MADITAQDYQDALDAMKPGSGVTDDQRTFAIQIKQEFEDQHAAQQGLLSRLDPSLPPMPQALAAAPATTYPGGDTKAEEAWMVDRGKSAKGTVVYYEPPLSVAKKDLLEHPEIGRMLYPNLDRIVDPEEVASLTPGSQLYDDYKNLKWRETAESAAQAGKTVYRYAKAPWLQSGGPMGKADTLALKADASAGPVLSSMLSFVGGVDKTAMFGAGDRTVRALGADPNGSGTVDPFGGTLARPDTKDEFSESLKPNPDEPTTEYRGGATSLGNYGEASQAAREENPLPNYGGQALGMLSSWSPANALFGKAAGLGTRAAEAAGGGAVARLATSAGAAAGAGAADQGIREGVNAAGDLAEHGETPITLQGALGNMGRAATVTGVAGGVLEGVGQVAKGGADTVATGNRYRGVPGRLENAGYEFSAMPAPSGGVKLSPETQEIIKLAQATDTQPGEMLAQEIAPKIKEAADVEVKSAIADVTQRKQEYFATREGQMRLPAKNLVDRSVQILRRKHEENAGALQQLDVSGTTGKVRDIFNNEIESVSATPVDGAIELSGKEAEAFLVPHWKGKLKPEKAAEASSGAREVDLEAAGADSNEAVKMPEKVYVVPRTHDAQSFEEVMHGVKGFRAPSGEGNSSRELQELDNAARLDRDARPRAGEPGGWSAMQAEHAKLLDASKSLEKLVSPRGKPFKVLTGYGQAKRGELLTVQALRKAADQGGVREQLETIRNLDPVMRLKAAGNYGPQVGSKSPRGFWSPGAHFDAAALRAFPVLRQLGGPESFIRSGRGGVLGIGQSDEEK